MYKKTEFIYNNGPQEEKWAYVRQRIDKLYTCRLQTSASMLIPETACLVELVFEGMALCPTRCSRGDTTPAKISRTCFQTMEEPRMTLVQRCLLQLQEHNLLVSRRSWSYGQLKRNGCELIQRLQTEVMMSWG